MRVLLLRLDAPLMSFGDVAPDSRRVTAEFPGSAMVVGMLANALGWDHRDHHRTMDLQQRIRLAARLDRGGERVSDFQTVDLDANYQQHGWTTWGRRLERGKGSATSETHIRERDYWGDRVVTVAVALEPADEEPTLDELAAALDAPERPLFIGRKACLPSTRLLLAVVEAATLREALLLDRPDPGDRLASRDRGRAAREADADVGSCWGQWPASEGGDPLRARLVPVYDLRDWTSGVHAGRRIVWVGPLDAGSTPHPGDGRP